jgi:hypothetical protein
MKDEPPLTTSGAVQQRINRICGLAALILRFWWLMPVVFWAMAIYYYTFFKWALFVGSAFSGWELAPALPLALIIYVWLLLRGTGGVDPALEKARWRVRLSLGLWVLTFPVPLIILFVARPDLFGPIGKMVLRNQREAAISIGALIIAAAIMAWRARNRLPGTH